jgi:hypothetical protein
MGAAETVLRAGLLKLGGSMLRQLLSADPGHRSPRVPCGQGHEAEFSDYRDKTFDTVLGPVTLRRAWYRLAECKHGFAPRDAELGMAGTSLSRGLTAMNDTAAATGPFAKAAGLLEDLAGVQLTVKRAERAAEASGAAQSAGVWLWGVRDEDDNLLVWERENTPGSGWTQTAERLDEFLWHFTLVDVVFGTRFGLGVNDVNSTEVARFTSAWTALPVKPWRWPGPAHALWIWDGLLAWTMVNDRPDSPVTGASTYWIFVGARSNQDLIHANDAGIARDWDSRNEL